MWRTLFRVGVVALITVLAGANVIQWHLRTRRGPIQDLPPGAPAVATDDIPAPPPLTVPRAVARNLVIDTHRRTGGRP